MAICVAICVATCVVVTAATVGGHARFRTSAPSAGTLRWANAATAIGARSCTTGGDARVRCALPRESAFSPVPQPIELRVLWKPHTCFLRSMFSAGTSRHGPTTNTAPRYAAAQPPRGGHSLDCTLVHAMKRTSVKLRVPKRTARATTTLRVPKRKTPHGTAGPSTQPAQHKRQRHGLGDSGGDHGAHSREGRPAAGLGSGNGRYRRRQQRERLVEKMDRVREAGLASAIPKSNIGYKLLQRMGWKPPAPLQAGNRQGQTGASGAMTAQQAAHSSSGVAGGDDTATAHDAAADGVPSGDHCRSPSAGAHSSSRPSGDSTGSGGNAVASPQTGRDTTSDAQGEVASGIGRRAGRLVPVPIVVKRDRLGIGQVCCSRHCSAVEMPRLTHARCCLYLCVCVASL